MFILFGTCETLNAELIQHRYRMAEFVTNSINNLSHGLTVQKAMEELGLRE